MHSEKVQIPGPDGPLEGTQIAIEGATHAVVLIPGSGPTDRDGNGPTLSTNSYKWLAEGLATAGIASLRIDKRGLFGSRAALTDANNVTLSDYAQDAQRWGTHAETLAPCVWLAGHSEGGLVALVAAQSDPQFCGLLLLATPGRPAGQVLLEQLAANPANAPLLPAARTIIETLQDCPQADIDTIPEDLRGLFAPAIQPFLHDLFSHHPTELATSCHRPTLVLQGTADAQVKVTDATALAKALPQATLAKMKGATHMLKPDIADQPLATYQDPSLPLHPEVVPSIQRFLDDHATTCLAQKKALLAT